MERERDENLTPESPRLPAKPEPRALESLSRFLWARIREAWKALNASPLKSRDYPQFSGILHLSDPRLLPYVDHPGVFLLLGPPPRYPILHLGACQGPLWPALTGKVKRRGDGSYEWRGEETEATRPDYVALAVLEEAWPLAEPLRERLARELGGDSLSRDSEESLSDGDQSSSEDVSRTSSMRRRSSSRPKGFSSN